MEFEPCVDFGGYRLHAYDGTDAPRVAASLHRGDFDGLYLSSERGFAGQDLEFLKELGELRILVINHAPGLDPAGLAHVPELEYLSIESPESVPPLGALRRLKTLRIRLPALPGSGLDGLEHLQLQAPQASDLQFLAACPALKTLEIVQARKLASLSGLEHCPNLVELALAYCPALQDISAVAALGRLEKLEFTNAKRLADAAPIGRLGELHWLILDRCAPLASLGFVGGLKKLRHLVVKDTPVLDRDFSPLLHLPALAHVFLDRKKEYQPVLGEVFEQVRRRAGAG